MTFFSRSASLSSYIYVFIFVFMYLYLFIFFLAFSVFLLNIDIRVIFCGYSFFPYSFKLSNKKLTSAVNSFTFVKGVKDRFAVLSAACMAEKSVLFTTPLSSS